MIYVSNIFVYFLILSKLISQKTLFQDSYGTPGITGYLEVEVNSVLVHSKKVCAFQLWAGVFL